MRRNRPPSGAVERRHQTRRQQLMQMLNQYLASIESELHELIRALDALIGNIRGQNIRGQRTFGVSVAILLQQHTCI